MVKVIVCIIIGLYAVAVILGAWQSHRDYFHRSLTQLRERRAREKDGVQ